MINKLYHATYRPFLDSIKENGLGATENKMWGDSKHRVVYLANDPWVAESYAECAEFLDELSDEQLELYEIVILEIDANQLDLDKLFVDENVILEEDEENATWEYHDIIPWSACEIFETSRMYEDFKEYENLWEDTEKRFRVIMIVDDEEYTYGTYESRDRANEVAMQVRDERDIETYIEEA